MTRFNGGVRVRLISSTILLSAALAASQARAQEEAAAPPEAADAAAEGPEIVVTGSLIRNPNLEASSPVSVIGQDEVELQQANVAEELLRELPGAVPSIGSAVNNGNGGFSFVNLRGVGVNRNIVLLDGVRLAPANLSGLFDLNNIPLALIERTEVLTGGASTTYGADAISGVVNFITRQDFSGVELQASNQITEEGDGNIFRVDVTVGANFDDGRGNAVFSIGYQEADPVYQGDRDFSFLQFDSFTGAGGGSGTAVPSRFTGVNTQGPCGGPGQPLCSVAQGTRQTNDAGGFLPTAAFTPFNFNPYNIFQTPFKRFNMYGAAHYEISDAVEVYTRGLFSKNTVSTIIAPSGAFGIAVTLPLNNPFLTAAQRNAFCAFDTDTGAAYTPRFTPAECAAAATATGPTDPNYRTVTTQLSRRAVEVGPRISDFTSQYFDYRLGFRGPVTDSIDWDVFGSYGEGDQVQVIQGFTLNSRVRQSILTAGNACQDTSNGCVPIDWFGPANNATFTPEAIDFLNENSTVRILTSQAQARGTVSGDFGWSLPWAAEPVSFAVGGEYRKYTASQQSDTLSQGGDLGGAGGAAPNIDGGYDVYEALGELIVPIVSDKPFAEELTLEAGIRYSHYSVDAPGSPSYNTTTYKIGGSWEPGWGLKFRGNYARAVRAPNIAELFTPQTTVLTNLADDPCANLDDNGNLIPGRPVPTGALRDVCIAQGAPAGTIGAIPVPTAGQANVTTGGNLNLNPEKADTYTIGMVYTPDFLPGFNMSLDYFNIKVKDAITIPTPGDSLAACFNDPSTSNPACLVIGRNPLTGALSGDPADTPGLFAPLSNLGELDNSGFDLTLNYRADLGFAKLALGFVGTYNIDSKFNADTTGSTTFARDCVGFYSVNCLSPQPEFQFSQRTTLTFGDVDVSLLWRYIDEMIQEPIDACLAPNPAIGADDPACTGEAFSGTLPASAGSFAGRNENFAVTDAANYFDLTTRFAINDNMSLTMSVQNLFDRKPPIVGNTIGSTTFNSGNTYPSTYDALGRRFAASVRLRF